MSINECWISTLVCVSLFPDVPGSADRREVILRCATLAGAQTAKLEATMAAILGVWLVR